MTPVISLVLKALDILEQGPKSSYQLSALSGCSRGPRKLKFSCFSIF
jgi:hypothetical protein